MEPFDRRGMSNVMQLRDIGKRLKISDARDTGNQRDLSNVVPFLLVS